MILVICPGCRTKVELVRDADDKVRIVPHPIDVGIRDEKERLLEWGQTFCPFSDMRVVKRIEIKSDLVRDVREVDLPPPGDLAGSRNDNG